MPLPLPQLTVPQNLTVTHTNHGAVVNDFVTYSGAASLGGLITATVLNQEYYVTEVVNTGSYKIKARAAGTSISDITYEGQLNPSLVAANGSDTGNGVVLLLVNIK